MGKKAKKTVENNKESLLDEIARLTTELAQEKRNTNFTYTAERQRLRKENEELRAKLADVEHDEHDDGGDETGEH